MNQIKIIGITVCALCIIALTGVGYENKANRLEKRVESAVAEIENVHDNVYKTISESYSVVKLSREDYDKYLRAYVEGRETVGEGANWLWVQDNVTQNDRSLYSQLMTVIENNRDDLTEANRKSNLAATEYNTYVSNFPQSAILFWRDEVEIKQVTSAKSKQALESGEDNEMLIQ